MVARWVAAALSAVMFSAQALAAELVVIASNAPSLSAGEQVDAAQVIEIPQGARATLLAASGRTITLEGPFRGPVDMPDGESGQSDTLTAIAALLAPADATVPILGQTRGAAPIEGPGNSLWIDTSRAGKYCVGPGRFLHLWRPQADERQSAKLTDMETGRSTTITWNGGEVTHAWPAALTYRDGAAYLVLVDGVRDPIHVEIRLISGGLDGALPRIAWMVEQGCVAQAHAELAAFQDQVDPFSLYMSTDRGADPTYTVGDTLTVKVKANRDAAIYCFYTAGDGNTIALFPSQFSGGAWVRGHETLYLPGDRLPVTLSIAPPPGQEIIRCYGTTRDVTRDLPTALVSGDFRPIEPSLANRIAPSFQEISDVRLANGEIVVRVE